MTKGDGNFGNIYKSSMQKMNNVKVKWSFVLKTNEASQSIEVRSAYGLTSASYPSSFQLLKSFIWILHHSIGWDRETSEFNGNRGILHLFFTPGATPGAKIPKNSKILKNCPRHSLRRSLRANKNLHIPSGYALSILLHNIYPQAMENLHMQIFLCPQATPGALPEAKFLKF
ncbi:hypothetical protein T11_1956 [Trichinella zimbabwensis]|uniref:Uncharacterized protein n=1 Tax=Trichinella zimbabwensis TaxID=268475 RepID=A0A0V1HT75_9BILA|nr:hypothetical protein T11_1956 [Trichinella zimbabwensis]